MPGVVIAMLIPVHFVGMLRFVRRVRDIRRRVVRHLMMVIVHFSALQLASFSRAGVVAHTP
jgi:hypothetical protein